MNPRKHGENLKEQNNEHFFVELKVPSEVRRNILEALKQIIEVLQRFEKFKHIRQEKLQGIHKVRILLRDANKLLGNLRIKLPQTNLRATVMKEPQIKHKEINDKKKKKEKPAAVKVVKAPKKEMTELEKLESELSAIENKLKGLS